MPRSCDEVRVPTHQYERLRENVERGFGLGALLSEISGKGLIDGYGDPDLSDRVKQALIDHERALKMALENGEV